MKSTILTLIVCFIMLIACEKNSNYSVTPSTTPVNVSVSKFKNEEKTFTHIDKNSPEVSDILKEVVFSNLGGGNQLDLDNMTIIKFAQRKGSSLLVIPIKSNDYSEKSLIINFVDKRLGKSLFLERKGDFDNNTFSGTLSIKTIENKVLREETVLKNRLVKTVVFEGISDETALKMSKLRQGSCSYAEFNYYYTIFKNNCSQDAACDIACTAAGPFCAGGMALQALDYCLAYDYNP
jgi:hypothetical protein